MSFLGFCCNGFRDAIDERFPSAEAAEAAYNISRAMQIGSRWIRVEPTKDGICIDFDRSLPSWNLEMRC